ncbi:MAG: hypothetical protein PHX15_02595, partial [Candidatus Nanoarchaeia archaeon]|nr:hypothetical protein [Candidatus Nanoarchaeia archaeon]
ELTNEEIEELKEMQDVDFTNLSSFINHPKACDLIKSQLESEIVGVILPKEVPFSNEVFIVFIDTNLIASVKLENKEITSFDCSNESEPTFEIYLSSSIFSQEQVKLLNENPIKFYLENKKVGNIEIKANGFMQGLKLGFMNFGIRIANLFI